MKFPFHFTGLNEMGILFISPGEVLRDKKKLFFCKLYRSVRT